MSPGMQIRKRRRTGRTPETKIMDKDMENSTQKQIQQKQPTPLQAFNRCITNSDVQSYLTQVLGEKKSSFVNNITALVANDAKLQECKPMSLIYAGIKATALDLPLDQNMGFAYVIPYKCKTGTEAQFQMGYKGFIQLAIRTGQFRTINVTEVVEGEIASENLITGEIQFVRAKDRTTKPVVGYVAFFSLLNGFSKMLYMSVEDIKAHAKRYSQTFSSSKDWVRESSKWTTDFDAMAKKTVLKLLLNRYAPLSVEMRSAVVSDQAVLNAEGQPDEYIDNPEPEEQPQVAVAEAVNEKKAEMKAAAIFGKKPDELL